MIDVTNKNKEKENKIKINSDLNFSEKQTRSITQEGTMKTQTLESIPQNWKFVANTIEENDNIRESLLIYTVTWNLKGQKPTDEELKMILPKLNRNNLNSRRYSDKNKNEIKNEINVNANYINTNTKTESPLKENKNSMKGNKFYHIYAITSQECMRSIFSSFFNSNKDEWLKMLQ